MHLKGPAQGQVTGTLPVLPSDRRDGRGHCSSTVWFWDKMVSAPRQGTGCWQWLTSESGHCIALGLAPCLSKHPHLTTESWPP